MNKIEVWDRSPINWRLLAWWALIHPVAIIPAVCMVTKKWPFDPPFVAYGHHIIVVTALAALPGLLLAHAVLPLHPKKGNG